jgi:hypothetical protein
MTETLTRREAITKLGKLGAMSALAMSPLARVASAAPPPCRPFSVVLHGLFLLDVFNDYIQISTPQVNGHSYLAGPFSTKTSDYTPVAGFHDQRWDSRVIDPPDPDKLEMPVLKKVGDPIHTKAFLSFLVPFPNNIHSFRTFTASEVNYPTDFITAKKFPLVVALEYTFPPRLPPIENTSFDLSRNYHVFAESPSSMNCDDAIKHGKEAIGKLWEMLPHQPNDIPLPKDLKKCSKPVDADSASPCGNHDEEDGLSELLLFEVLELARLKKDDERFDSIHLPLCANFIVP